jgi:thiol-disulfide isomerase/thioredoxin
MKEIGSTEELKKCLKSSKPLAIFMYMTSCGHCQAMHEPWSALAKDTPNIQFAKVNSELVPDEMGITGYPYFVMVKDGATKKTSVGQMDKDELKKNLLGGGRRHKGRNTRRVTRRVRKVLNRSSSVHVSLRK